MFRVELENASKRIEVGMEIFVPRAFGGTLEMKTIVQKKKDNVNFSNLIFMIK